MTFNLTRYVCKYYIAKINENEELKTFRAILDAYIFLQY